MSTIIILGGKASVIAAILAKIPEAIVSPEFTKIEFKVYEMPEPPRNFENYRPVVKRGKGKVKKW